MRDYNFREKEKKKHLVHYNKYFCLPRTPRLKTDNNGNEYIVEGK